MWSHGHSVIYLFIYFFNKKPQAKAFWTDSCKQHVLKHVWRDTQPKHQQGYYFKWHIYFDLFSSLINKVIKCSFDHPVCVDENLISPLAGLKGIQGAKLLCCLSLLPHPTANIRNCITLWKSNCLTECHLHFFCPFVQWVVSFIELNVILSIFLSPNPLHCICTCKLEKWLRSDGPAEKANICAWSFTTWNLQTASSLWRKNKGHSTHKQFKQLRILMDKGEIRFVWISFRNTVELYNQNIKLWTYFQDWIDMNGTVHILGGTNKLFLICQQIPAKSIHPDKTQWKHRVYTKAFFFPRPSIK